MENISTSTSSNSSLPSPSLKDFPPRVDGIALCSVYLFEAVLIVGKNLLTIDYFRNKKESPQEKFVSSYKHGVC